MNRNKLSLLGMLATLAGLALQLLGDTLAEKEQEAMVDEKIRLALESAKNK